MLAHLVQMVQVLQASRQSRMLPAGQAALRTMVLLLAVPVALPAQLAHLAIRTARAGLVAGAVAPQALELVTVAPVDSQVAVAVAVAATTLATREALAAMH